jgi:hypothetical protein
MPRYFFHAQDGEKIFDHDGLNLPNLDEVRKEMLSATAELITSMHAQSEFWSGAAWKLWVTDQPGGEGHTLLTLEISVRSSEHDAVSSSRASVGRRWSQRLVN